MKRTAITLVELLVVTAIIGLLSAVAVTATTNANVKGRDAKRLGDKRAIINALNVYYSNNGSWPATNDNWVCFGAATTESCWTGSYNGLDALKTAMAPYMTSSPTTGTMAGNNAYNRYLYMSSATNPVVNGLVGAALIWPKENAITTSECPAPSWIVKLDKYWYCYEYLGPP